MGSKNKLAIEYRKKNRLKSVTVRVAIVAIPLLLMLQPQAVISAMEEGLKRCALTVIPALFPFMVAGELLVRSDAVGGASGKIFRPIGRLLGISPKGVVALVMGWLCGFPVGARTAAAYAQRGELSQRELSHLLCFCNVPSAAFLVNVVGVSLFGSMALGQALLALTLLSAAVVAIVFRRLFFTDRQGTRVMRCEEEGRSGDGGFHFGLIGQSMAAAAVGMINVCATVLFFGALLHVLTALLTVPLSHLDTGTSGIIRCLFTGLFEITGGVCEGASLCRSEAAAAAPVLCAAVVGWGGLSVHFQIFSSCEGCRPSYGLFWLSRLVQAALCALGMWLLLVTGVLPFDADVVGNVPAESVGLFRPDTTDGWVRLWAFLNLILLVVGVLIWMMRRRRAKRA